MRYLYPALRRYAQKPLDEVGTTRTLRRVTRFRERKTAEVSSDFPDRSWGSPQGPRRPRFSFLLFTCQTAWAETREPKLKSPKNRSPSTYGLAPISASKPPVRFPPAAAASPKWGASEERQTRRCGGAASMGAL